MDPVQLIIDVMTTTITIIIIMIIIIIAILLLLLLKISRKIYYYLLLYINICCCTILYHIIYIHIMQQYAICSTTCDLPKNTLLHPSHTVIYHYHHFHEQWNSSKQDALFLWKKFKISSLPYPSMAQLQYASMIFNAM